MLRIGHRGAAGHVLENTLGSIEKAIELGGDRAEYYYSLGLSYVNLDNCAKGKEWIDKAIKINADDTAAQAAEQYYDENCLGSQSPPTRLPPTRVPATAVPATAVPQP